jgi:hypothetical protein
VGYANAVYNQLHLAECTAVTSWILQRDTDENPWRPSLTMKSLEVADALFVDGFI